MGERRNMGASRSLVAVLAGFLAPLVMAGGCNKCQKDEAPPPLPTATAVETKPDAQLVLEVEDAADDGDAADGDAKKVGTGSSASMKKCCQAVAQNAESAPEPTKTYMKQMAAACFAAAGAGKGWSGGGFSCK
ncbi:MAG: acyltransferase [Polyangiaceae bacterium]|nr:acyltransferase [Myxococcales bacterium]MCC6901467.1 acyltransferase [Polyangiaceae bacterium]